MGDKLKDLTGQKFGKLTVLNRAPSVFYAKFKKWRVYWNCKCDCGNIKTIVGSSLKRGLTTSCGCLGKSFHIKHGKYQTKIYYTWAAMIQRCNNDKHPQFKDYGGRGIKVCKRWLNFENFLYDVGEPPTKRSSLDRIKNNEDYKPGNTRWTNFKTQARNTRQNKLITYNNETKCLIEWAEIYDLKVSTLSGRLERGWDIHKALTAPLLPSKWDKIRNENEN